MIAILGSLLAAALPAFARTEKVRVTDRKLAPDKVTSGWFLAYPWPDQNEVSQRWRIIPATLVLARHGHVIRRIEADTTFWSWSFWNGGKQVAYQTGPMHGETECVLADVATGHQVKTWTGDCRNAPDNAPDWVKAATDSDNSR